MKARFLALAALVLGLASCQNDFDAANVGAGGEVDFQLSVAAPELATRAGENGADDKLADLNSAYGAIDYFQGGTAGDDLRWDWSDVNLRYTLEVYDVDENGNLVGEAPYAPVKDRQVIIVDEYQPVTFELRLVPKRHYRFVVFADFVPNFVTNTSQSTAIALQENLGINHKIGETLADIKLVNHGINDERTDAYFGYENFEITNSASNDIVLKRPYGKLRVIATDLHELNLNVNPAAVKVEYTATHLTNFDAVTGKATVDQNNTKRVFDSEYNEIYKEADEGGLQNHFYTTGYDALEGHKYTNANWAVRHTHMTLFTDYILADDLDQPQPVHFTMTVYEEYDNKAEDGRAIKSTTFNTDIPIQRNYLTTVIGNVLTTATEVEVRIDDNFSNGTEWNPEEDDFDIELVEVDSAKTLQEALDNYVNGQTIFLVGDIEGNVTVDQVEGKDYVIDGNGFNYDGTIYIDGNARSTGAETLTIRNINFATDKDKINFIEQNSTDGAVRYPHNVTVENCSFRATGVDVIALKIRQGYNITVKDCVADGVTRANASGMHSLGQFYGCTGITIDGVNFNAGRGVSFGTSLNVIVKNSTFVAESYGLRADASVATTLTLENVNISANLPVVARECTADYTINISGENTFDAPGYQIVFTKGDDATPFVTPTSNWKLNGGVGLRVFPGNTALYAYDAKNLQYLLDNATGNTEIHLAADIVGDVTATQKADVKVTIEGNNHNYAGVITVDGQSATYTTAGLTIKNLNFEAETISADACIRLGDGTNATRYACNVAVEGCTFNVPGAVAVKSYTGGDKNLTIKGCTATNLHSLLQVKNIEGVTIEGVNVTGGRGASFGVSSNIVVKNSTFVAESYGLRVDATAEATLAIENVKITAKLPVVARKTSKNYTINFTGDNTLETSGYQVVFTTGDDEDTFVAPATYTLTGADSFRVFPRDADQNDYIYTAADLQAAIDAGKTDIVLQPGEYKGTINLKSDVTIEGLDGAVAHCFNLNGADNVTLKNIEFDAAKAKMAYDGNGGERFYASIMSGGANKNGKGTNGLVIDGCTFTGHFDNGGTTIAFTDQSRNGGQSGNITIKNCTFETTGGYVDIYTYYSGMDAFNIENNIFKSETFDRPIYLGRYQSSTPVVVKGNRFEKSADFASATYLQAHSTAYSPSFDESDNTFAN